MTFLANSGDNSERQERQLNSLLEHGVDGVLLSPAEGTARAMIEDATRSGVPVVQVSRSVARSFCDTVGLDNASAAARAVRHLLDLGHRRIAFIGGTSGSSARAERLEGYSQALTSAGIAIDPALAPLAAPTRANGALLARQLLGEPTPPTAVLCYHDLMALGAMEGARAAGLRVGEDFAVVGFDDILEASLSRPPLTTLHIDAEEIGREAARCLVLRLNGDKSPPRRIIVPAHLVIRASCGSRRVSG